MGDRVIPVRVLLDEKARADLQVLEQIRVPTRAGPGVPLASLADITFDASPVSISRYDRQRQARVEADLVEGYALSDAAKGVRNLGVIKNLPPGVTVGDGGDAELQAELFEGFGAAMRNGLLMVYIVLAVLFSSVLHPLTILLSLPLSIAGAIAALLITSLPITTPVVNRHPHADGYRHRELEDADRLRSASHACRSRSQGRDHRRHRSRSHHFDIAELCIIEK